MDNLSDAFNTRKKILMAQADPQKGGDIAGFVGAGLWSDAGKLLMRTANKFKPYAISALDKAISGFHSGYGSTKGDISQKLLGALAEAGKQGGSEALSGLGKVIKGGSLVDRRGNAINMSAQPKLMQRPKI